MSHQRHPLAGAGPRPPSSPLGRMQVRAFDAEGRKRNGWRDHGILVVDVADARLTWPERELVKQLGQKLYGARPREASHG